MGLVSVLGTYFRVSRSNPSRVSCLVSTFKQNINTSHSPDKTTGEWRCVGRCGGDLVVAHVMLVASQRWTGIM